MTRCLDAVIDHDSEAVRAWLATHPDRAELGKALGYAMLQGFDEIFALCREAGIDLNVPFPYTGYPLQLALNWGKCDAFRQLRAHGADPSFLGAPETVALICAAFEERIEDLEALLRDGGDPNARDVDGVPVLCHAAKTGRVELLRLLLDSGADINAVWWEEVEDDPEYSAFRNVLYCVCPPDHQAEPLRYLESLKLLLDRGALLEGPCGPNGKRWFPLDTAIYGDWAAGVRLMLEHGASLSVPLESLSSIGYISLEGALPVLLEFGLRDNQEAMRRVFRGAAKSDGKRTEIRELLASAGFQPNLTDAVLDCDPELVRRLLAQGADPRFTDTGTSLVELAKAQGGWGRLEERAEIVQLLEAA